MNDRVYLDLSNFIFVEDELKKADAILIPGSSKWQITERAAELYRKGYSELVIPAGKFSSKNGRFACENIRGSQYDGEYQYEYEFCRHILMENGVPEERILCEKLSTNTFENALFTKQLLDSCDMQVASVIVCCQAYHARRVLMTYGHVFPGVRVMIAPVETKGITKDSWVEKPESRRIVLGEVEKIGKYFKKYYMEEKACKFIAFHKVHFTVIDEGKYPI